MGLQRPAFFCHSRAAAFRHSFAAALSHSEPSSFVIPTEVEESLIFSDRYACGAEGSKRCLDFARHDKSAVKAVRC
jgi:hypothetical protein